MAKTYTVKSGDSLSRIYKSLGYSSWQDLWNNWKSQSRSGNYNLIYAGEQIPYKNQPAPAPSVAKKTTPAPAAKPPSQTLTDTATKDIQTREQFAKRFGTVDELTPTAAMQQFAAQQTNPYYFEQARLALRDMSRNAAATGAYRVGQTNTDMQRTLAEVNRQRMADIENQLATQKELFASNWYYPEMESYMTSATPSKWGLSQIDLTGYGIDNSAYDNMYKYEYNPLNMSNYFGGYGSLYKAPEQMYGSLVKTDQPLLAEDRTNIRY